MAAGLGFKTFTVGEVLSAADVNGYLMQGVLVFATTAARDAAITSPQEGQFAFTKDTNSLFYYDGATWVASGATGDIEGVTAGTGISGGGTSGTVTVTNSMATAIDAKGDLIVGTGADTFSRLAVGTNTYTLVADSAEATGLKWAAPAGGGLKLVAIQSTVKTDTFTTASSSYVDITGLSVNITPTSSSSKILVFWTFNGSQEVASGRASLKLLRDSTVIMAGAAVGSRTPALGAFGALDQSIPSAPVSGTFYDSPATTSSITYKAQIAVNAGSGSAYVNRSMQDTDAAASIRMASSITVMEIL